MVTLPKSERKNTMKKVLSLLLVVCMMLPMVALLPIPTLAATAQDEVLYSTSFADHIPTYTNSAFVYTGGWSAGFYAPGTYADPDSMISLGWAGTQNGFGTVATSGSSTVNALFNINCTHVNYHVKAGTVSASSAQSAAIRYTAEATGTVNISFDQLGNIAPLAGQNNGPITFSYYIYKNGVKIWPLSGEDNQAVCQSNKDIIIDTKTLAVSNLSVTVGDKIDFICASDKAWTAWGSSGNAMFATIDYVPEKEVEEGTVVQSSAYTDHFPTASGATPVFSGDWSVVDYTPGTYNKPHGAVALDWAGTTGNYAGLISRGANPAFVSYGNDTTNYYGIGTVAAHSGKSVAVRYTAPEAGIINIYFDKLGQFASGAIGNFTYYVYVDGVKVWPADDTTVNTVAGPNASGQGKTAPIYESKTLAAADIRVSEGSVVDFICENDAAFNLWGNCGNALFGRVEYTEILPYVASFPGTDNTHIPTLLSTTTVANTSNLTSTTVTYADGIATATVPSADASTVTIYKISTPGNWAAIAFPRGYYSNPVTANLLYRSSALALSALTQEPVMSEVWADKAHVNIGTTVNGNYYPMIGSMMVTNNYSAGLRYTAEKSGIVDISFDKLGNYSTLTAFYDGTARSMDNFRYGIFVNGEMVWPVKGGTLSATKPLSEYQNSYVKAIKGLEVKAGDIIDFICEGVGIAPATSDNHAGCWDGAGNVMYPQVEYTTVYKSNLSVGISLGNQFALIGKLDPTESNATEAGVIINGEKLVGVKQTDGTYLVRGPVFNAKNIVDEVTIQGYYVRPLVGDAMQTIYDAEVTTSVAKLLAAYVGSTDKTLSKYSALAAATLEYAAMAQTYFGYETDKLANADLMGDIEVKGTYDPSKLFTVVANPASANVLPSEISLLLRDTVGLHFKFRTRDGSALDMSTYKLQVASDAAFTTTSSVDIVEGNGYYKAEMLGITASNWNASFFFRVVDKDGNVVSPTFTYGVSAYYARMSANDEVADLVKSMMLVHEAVKTQSGGSTMDANNDAMLPNATTGTEVVITPANLATALAGGTLEAGKVYAVSGTTIDLTGVENANGNGAIIKPNGTVLTVTGLTGTMRDLTVVGALTLDASSGTLVSVEAVSTAATALTVNASCSSLSLHECRFTTTSATAITNNSKKLTVYHCYMQAATTAINETAMASEGLYEDCVLYGNVTVAADDTTIRYCTVRGSITATGAENLLVGGCHFAGKDDSITFNTMHNSVILLNDITNVTVKNSTSAYVSNNSIYGALLLDNSKYLVVEDNALHTARAELVSCASYVGDNVTDITKRNEYGVYTPLLPQIDEDAHINMTRKTYVRAVGKEVELSVYVNTNLKSGRALMVNPGAYIVSAGGGKNKIKLQNVENADLYAYGVLYERDTIYSNSFEAYNCKDVSIYGIAFSFPVQTSGQMYVVQKLGNNQVKCLVGAGVVKSWNNNSVMKHESAYRNDEPYSYSDIGGGTVTFDDNGFATVTYPALQYEQMKVGDVITCRRADSLTYIYECDGMLFEDVAVLGGTVRCFWDDYCERGTTLNRVIDKPMPAKIITKAEYNKYLGYQNTYGVDFGIEIDERGNYRGSPSRTATADFAHSSASKIGFQVSNCIVSGLSDDGTNNQGYKHRVVGYNASTGVLSLEGDNGWGYGLVEEGGIVRRYDAGEEVLIYSSTGEYIATTTVLEDFRPAGDQTTGTIKVDASKIPANAFSKFDLTDSYSGSYKVLIHSNDRKCNGVTFDNVLFENIRSRGALVKGSDITIKNCSFYNIGMAAIGMNFELKYGESGYVNNVTIKNNYFYNTGYFDNYTYYAPISLDSPAVKGDDAYLISSNILIEHNKMQHRGTSHSIFLRGVKNVTIKDNNFGWSQTGSQVDIYAMFVNNMTVSGNTYSSLDLNDPTCPEKGYPFMSIYCSNYRNLSGSDITDGINGMPGYSSEDPLMSLNAYAYEESRTYFNGSSVVHSGNWQVGYMTNANSFSPYNYINDNATSTYLTSLQFFTGSDYDAWNGKYGSIGTIIRDFRFNPAGTYGAAYCYTMDKDASNVRVSISTFFPPYADTSNVGGNNNGWFTVIVQRKANSYKGETAYGGTVNWTNQSSWFVVTQTTSQADLNNNLSGISLNLKKGDRILFVAKRASSSASTMFAAVPVVYY